MLYPLVCSSHLFLFNSIYAYHIEEQTVSFVLFSAYLFSTLHYITNRYNSIYHKCDLVISRLTTIYISLYTLNFLSVYYTFIIVNNVCLSYALSKAIHSFFPNRDYSIYCHFYFHFISNFCIYTLLNTGYKYKIGGKSSCIFL